MAKEKNDCEKLAEMLVQARRDNNTALIESLLAAMEAKGCPNISDAVDGGD